MKNYFLVLFISIFISNNGVSQTRGVKIGYIDMEFILEKVPNYAEAKSQLEEKAQKWKQEIETKKIEIAKLKEALKTEKVLLTKELIDEREEEITFLETELLEYQQKKFGPNGDLIIQKAVLVKPIQDQVFNVVQDIAEAKKYDFIFDKSSDLTMLFAGKRFDISDQVVRALSRAEKREEMTKSQLKKEQEQERKQDQIDENPTLSDRQKVLDEKKAARLKLIEDRKIAADEKKKAFAEKRKQLVGDKNGGEKTGTVSDKGNEDDANATDAAAKDAEYKKEEAKYLQEQKQADALAAKSKTLEERQKLIDDRKKDLDAKKAKAIADREALKKAKEEERKKLLENKPK